MASWDEYLEGDPVDVSGLTEVVRGIDPRTGYEIIEVVDFSDCELRDWPVSDQSGQ